MINSAASPLTSILQSLFNQGASATSSSDATSFANAIASIVPMGFIQAGISMVPLVPAGLAACQVALNALFNAGVSGTSSSASQQMASAIATVAPLCPPSGLAMLQTLLLSAFNAGASGTPAISAQSIANAVVQYYLAGTVT